MEKDDEISGNGNNYTAEFWQYDSRLGRRWNIDPVVKPHESSYAAFAGNPISYTDPDGRNPIAIPAGMAARLVLQRMATAGLIAIYSGAVLVRTMNAVELDLSWNINFSLNRDGAAEEAWRRKKQRADKDAAHALQLEINKDVAEIMESGGVDPKQSGKNEFPPGSKKFAALIVGGVVLSYQNKESLKGWMIILVNQYKDLTTQIDEVDARHTNRPYFLDGDDATIDSFHQYQKYVYGEDYELYGNLLEKRVGIESVFLQVQNRLDEIETQEKFEKDLNLIEQDLNYEGQMFYFPRDK